jgi:hypothetical protein
MKLTFSFPFAGAFLSKTNATPGRRGVPYRRE